MRLSNTTLSWNATSQERRAHGSYLRRVCVYNDVVYRGGVTRYSRSASTLRSYQRRVHRQHRHRGWFKRVIILFSYAYVPWGYLFSTGLAVMATPFQDHSYRACQSLWTQSRSTPVCFGFWQAPQRSSNYWSFWIRSQSHGSALLAVGWALGLYQLCGSVLCAFWLWSELFIDGLYLSYGGRIDVASCDGRVCNSSGLCSRWRG